MFLDIEKFGQKYAATIVKANDTISEIIVLTKPARPNEVNVVLSSDP
jgi:hypothetical protein